MSGEVRSALRVRPLVEGDLARVVRIDALHTGRAQPDYWRRVFDDFLARRHPDAIGLGVDGPDGLAGYLFAEVRAIEFGSEPCGWVFAVGVDPDQLRGGIASRLLDAVLTFFGARGVDRVRTMVRRNDVPVLSFFRSRGFTGGPFVQLELDLEERA
jgi:ribosomal protein S18 acetylase RimI-like enzyme